MLQWRAGLSAQNSSPITDFAIPNNSRNLKYNIASRTMAAKTSSFHFYVATLLYVLTIIAPASAQEFTRTINVAGDGSVSSPPDLATINAAVVTTDKTAKAALSENNKVFANVLKVLGEQGIDAKDVQTTFFNVNPQFERRKPGQNQNQNRTPRKIIGYRVTNEVTVKVRDIDSLGDVLDALVTAGSNRISGVFFSVDDAKAAMDEARKLAVADARGRAELYATAAGVKVGKVLSISEITIEAPSRPSAGLLGPSFQQVSVPIASGELDVSTQVFILFELIGA